MKVEIPLGKGKVEWDVPEARCAGVLRSRLPAAAADARAEVARAMDAPVGCARLEELARGKRTCTIIASDHTRPVPSKAIIPEMLERLRAGAPDIDVTILIATGFHRATTRAELVAKFGEEIVARERIVVHDGSDEAALAHVGTLPSGGALVLNRLAVETDLLVSEGFIEPHFFAGFSGGRKSVLPGVAARRTVLANHCAEFIASDRARTGVLEGNPIHRDMVFAAETARLAFIVNVVIDGAKNVVRAFAGDFRAAHAAGCEFLRGLCGVEAPPADIVVTSNGGYPLDQNVYQAVKGMTAAEAVCRDGGVIVMCASCADGHGGESFYRNLAGGETPRQILERVARVPRTATEPDQWEFQILARVLSRHTVVMVTRECPHALLRAMGLRTADTVEEAVALAETVAGADARILVIPDGVSVIARASAGA